MTSRTECSAVRTDTAPLVESPSAVSPPSADAIPGHDYQHLPTFPVVTRYSVATGGLIHWPSVSGSVRRAAASTFSHDHAGVLVLDLGDARFETQVLLDMLTAVWREATTARRGSFALVVATDQPSVQRIAEMVAETENLPMYVMPSSAAVSQARPAGRLTPTEGGTLALLQHLGGQVTASRFAQEASLELTAAGNRLTGLAKRGYVFRVPRSRRDGDLFVGLGGLPDGKDYTEGSVFVSFQQGATSATQHEPPATPAR